MRYFSAESFLTYDSPIIITYCSLKCFMICIVRFKLPLRVFRFVKLRSKKRLSASCFPGGLAVSGPAAKRGNPLFQSFKFEIGFGFENSNFGFGGFK